MNHNDIGTTMKYAKLSKSSGEKHVNRLIESIMNIQYNVKNKLGCTIS